MNRGEKRFYRSKDDTKLCGIFLIPEKVKGYVLLAHGITVDKNEWDNFYVDIAQELYKKEFASVRFDFRGHGESGGTQREMTVIGETLDIAASIEQISKRWTGNISIVGMSFGAGPSILYSAPQNRKIKALILLCPVLDYIATFLKPIVPWARNTFNEKGFKYLDKKGFLLLDDEFELGAKLIEEFKVIKPYEILKEIQLPVLVIHGDKDEMVPYQVSRKYGKPNKKSKLITIRNAGHGFNNFDDETGKSMQSILNKRRVIEEVVSWVERWNKP